MLTLGLMLRYGQVLEFRLEFGYCLIILIILYAYSDFFFMDSPQSDR